MCGSVIILCAQDVCPTEAWQDFGWCFSKRCFQFAPSCTSEQDCIRSSEALWLRGVPVQGQDVLFVTDMSLFTAVEYVTDACCVRLL